MSRVENSLTVALLKVEALSTELGDAALLKFLYALRCQLPRLGPSQGHDQFPFDCALQIGFGLGAPITPVLPPSFQSGLENLLVACCSVQ